MDAAGTVRTAPRDSDDARALLGGLGLVGIVAEVEVALQPTTNVRGRTRLVKGDGNLFGDIRAALQARRGGLGARVKAPRCRRAGRLAGRLAGWLAG